MSATFERNMTKILTDLFEIEDDFGQYSDKPLDTGITVARAIKCFKNTKDVSYYATKFKSFDLDKRDFIRVIVEIPCRNNLRSKNLDLIIQYMKQLEAYFVYNDYIKLYFGDGLIHIDSYREVANKFCKQKFLKEH